MAEEKKEQEKPEAKEAEKSEGKEAEKTVAAQDDDFRQRVRVSGVILDGGKELSQAITSIRGIGMRTAKITTKKLGYKKGKKLGSLTDKDIEKLEEKIENLKTITPEWMLNKQKEPNTGETTHLIGPDLDMSLREDITRQQKIKSYKGIRHSLHLPVRGQRTRSSFRKGATLGVVRKKAMPGKK